MFYIARRFIWPFHPYRHVLLKPFAFSSFRTLQREDEVSMSFLCDGLSKPRDYFHGIKLPHLSPYYKDHLESFNIELVDHDLWNSMNSRLEKTIDLDDDDDAKDDGICNGDATVLGSHDFDVIDDLRVQKKLFYKLDKDSKEYEECNLRLPLKKSFKKSSGKQSKTVKECKKSIKSEKSSPKQSRVGPTAMKEISKCQLPNTINSEVCNKERVVEGKKTRTPTFNQLTDPYHLPFCLDIFITKGSIRACVIHRVSSKVVAVSHSISKDMKFDLASRKDATTCAAVGEILAQRAIEDDIHNVVYTPRKGDKIEGKLQIVLQSIIDHGVDVLVKLKQNRIVKKRDKSAATNLKF